MREAAERERRERKEKTTPCGAWIKGGAGQGGLRLSGSVRAECVCVREREFDGRHTLSAHAV